MGDLDAQLLCKSLQDNKKANVIILEKLGLTAKQLSNTSEDAFVIAFNEVLKMRDFPKKVDIKNLKPHLPNDMQQLVGRYFQDDNAISDQELKKLNRSLLQAIYPQETRKSHFKK